MDEKGDQLTAVHNSKPIAIGTPCNVVDGSLLVEGDTAIKIACCTEKIHGRLSTVTHFGVVDLGLGKHQGLGSEVVPLDLNAISLVEGLRARWNTGKGEKTVDLNPSRSTLLVVDGSDMHTHKRRDANLFLRNKDRDGWIQPRTE